MSSLPQNSELHFIEDGIVCCITYGMAHRMLGCVNCVSVRTPIRRPDTDLGEIYVRPPKILMDTKVVAEGVVWRIKKALYGLRTSPIAWETERDNTLRSLKWTHEETEYSLLPCQGSPCLWTVIPIRPGEDPSIKTSKEELTRGVVITYEQMLHEGWCVAVKISWQKHSCVGL